MGKPKLFVINLCGGNNLVYFSGSSVKGTVFLEFSEPKEVKGISIVLSGRAYVHWTEPKGYGYKIHSDTEIVLKDGFIQLWGNGRDSQELAAGRHEFPFNFHLRAQHLPTSFESQTQGQTGYIRYTLLAKIHRRESWLDHAIARAIAVDEIVNINDTPRLRKPHETQMKRRFNVAALVAIDRGGYCRGESIAIRIEAENHSNKRITNIQAALFQGVIYNAGSHSRERSHIIRSIKYPEIGPGATSKWNNLYIPATIPPTGGCHILNWLYYLRVTLGDVLDFIIPITIGNVPFQAQGGQSTSVGNRESQNLPSVSTAPYTPPPATNPYPPDGQSRNHVSQNLPPDPPPPYPPATNPYPPGSPPFDFTIPVTIDDVPFQAQGGQSTSVGNRVSQNLPSVPTAPYPPSAAANPYPPGIPPGETFNYSTACPEFDPPPSYAEAIGEVIKGVETTV